MDNSFSAVWAGLFKTYWGPIPVGWIVVGLAIVAWAVFGFAAWTVWSIFSSLA